MGLEPPLLRWFEECRKDAVAAVGGKNASLGELINAGIRVPPGFAVTTAAYDRFVEEGGIAGEISRLLQGLDHKQLEQLDTASAEVRGLIENAPLSAQLSDAIAEAYDGLCKICGTSPVPVAVRSSATAEDLPGASFAGQQETFLWILGPDEVLRHLRRCFSSLYTARAIAYRVRMGFAHQAVSISVGIQKMANADAAGVMFTINPVNGDRSMVSINANYAFGESVVSGEVTPDEILDDKISQDIVKRNISR
ncbi:MAG: PEP/pyruvate-binding domain-containing protein, partial [bacterium]